MAACPAGVNQSIGESVAGQDGAPRTEAAGFALDSQAGPEVRGALCVQGRVTRLLKPRVPEEYQRRGEDEFYRAIRHRIEHLAPDKKSLKPAGGVEWHEVSEKMLCLRGPANRPVFRLNRRYQQSML